MPAHSPSFDALPCRLRAAAARVWERRWLATGLRGKMAGLVAVALIGLLTVFALLGISTTRRTGRQVLSERVMLARLTAGRMDAALRTTESVMAILASPALLGGAGETAERAAMLRPAFEQMSVFGQGLYLLDTAGRPLAAAEPAHREVDWAAVPAVADALAGSPLGLAAFPGQQCLIVMAMPVPGASGSNVGVLAALLDLGDPNICPLEGLLELGQTGVVDVVDPDGLVLASSRPERVLLGTDRSPELRERLAAGRAGTLTCAACYVGGDESAGEQVIAFAPVSRTPWTVIVRQDAEEFFRPVTDLTLQTTVLGILSLLGALTLVWLVTNGIIEPVQMLAVAAGRIAGGDLATPITFRRRDEIGTLAEQFDVMRERLAQSIGEARALNRELDVRVQERTQAARAAQTEAERLAQSLLRRNQELEILNSINVKVNESLDLGEILGHALEEVMRFTGLDAGAIFLRRDGLGSLELLAHRGLSEDAARLAAQLGLLDGSCGGVVETQQMVVVPDISQYHGRRAASLQREHLNTLIHVPLVARGCALGSMCVGTRCPHEYDTQEQQLLNAIANQIAVAVENARLYGELAAKERLRGELLRKIISAQEEERKRIARELHDDTSQALTALLYAAESAAEVDSLSEVKEMLEGMRTLAGCTLDNVHKLIFDLRPSVLDHLGLVPALRWLAESRLGPAGIRVNVLETTPLPRLSPEAETALFRTVQEAIGNVARHAMARNVHIRFDSGDQAVTVVVEDDGIGFDLVEMAVSPDSSRGLGLAGMYERAHLLGGEVEIDSAPGYGTRVYVRMPVNGKEG